MRTVLDRIAFPEIGGQRPGIHEPVAAAPAAFDMKLARDSPTRSARADNNVRLNAAA